MNMSVGSYRWVGTMLLAVVLTLGFAGMASAQGLDDGGDNPSDCDWEALAAVQIYDIHAGQADRLEYDISWGDVSADPQTFEEGATVTFTLESGESTDNSVFATNLDCSQASGTDDRNYEGPGGDPLDLPEDSDFYLGMWYFLDDTNGLFHPFLVLENAGVPAGPNLTLNVVGATYAEAGGSISMSANETMMSPYQWAVDGSDIGGATNATLTLSPTVTGDSGLYTLDFDDGEAKATLTSNGVGVAIFDIGTLPVGGLIGLALLSTGLLAGGVSFARRKKA